jgi:ABC-type transport system involved in multi-copper enzyme maturation permease subunit
MTPILSLAHHTLLDALRERLLRTLALFLAVLVLAARLAGPLALGEGERVTRDLGLALLSLFGFLLVLLLGTRMVQKEVEGRTILLLLARPLRRGEFLVGKYLGLLAVVGIGLAGMLAILAGVLALSGYGVDGALVLAGLYVFLELAIVSALALLLAACSSPLLAAFLLLALYVAGHLIHGLLDMARIVTQPALAQALRAAFYLLPRLDLFGGAAPLGALPWAATYALLYATGLILLALIAFRRREFS